MNDNQRIFAAFFVILVAALNTQAGNITGEVTRSNILGASLGDNILATAATTYCREKGDINLDGTFDQEDIIQAQLIFGRGGQWLRRNYNSALDVYPVQEPCGDGQLTHQDLLILISMQERRTDENEGASINN